MKIEWQLHQLPSAATESTVRAIRVYLANPIIIMPIVHLKYSICGALILVLSQVVAWSAPEPSDKGTPLRLGPHRDVTISSLEGGVYKIDITGNSPHFWSHKVAPPPAERRMLAFEYFSTSGINSFSVRFRNADGEMVLVGSKALPLAETWQPFALELSALPGEAQHFHFSLKQKPGGDLRLRQLRLREPVAAELAARQQLQQRKQAREADGEAFRRYLQANYESEIDAVLVGEKVVTITGRAAAGGSLVELPIHVASHQASTLPPQVIDRAGNFSIELPRVDASTGRDRALSRWRLDNPEGGIDSLAKWPTRVAEGVVGSDLPELVADSQKGIGGVPSIHSEAHPLFELGVDHATVNFVLDSLLHVSNRPGLTPWQFEGRKYFLNEKFLADREATIRALRSKNIVVTCILLVGNREASAMKHPEAEARGIYAMPDLATEKGAHYYRAVISFITAHFSKPGRRISNWVIHNEIDQHGVWTNMGEQPMIRYLECYARSARIVYHSARLHDPHARVFISLTHHWTKPSIGTGSFVVRDLIDQWSAIASAEGEFGWGVAYHPYPQNLRDPDTWDDKDVSYDFDTPYITPKNIEVLPAYLGSERPILLSEQGFNSPTLSEVDQKRQAAGLIYVFRKIRQLPSIEAYHLHRYQDMPDNEGGLRLGIMDENGNRKIGWQVYRDLGTDAEAGHAASLEGILPVEEPLRKTGSNAEGSRGD